MNKREGKQCTVHHQQKFAGITVRLFENVVSENKKQVHQNYPDRSAQNSEKPRNTCYIIRLDNRSGNKPCDVDVHQHEHEWRMKSSRPQLIHCKITEVQQNQVTDNADLFYIM